MRSTTPPSGPTRALVYVPDHITDPDEFATIAAPCKRVEACHYLLAGVVRTWETTLRMLITRQADVVIVLDRAQLDDRVPRIEAVDDPIPATRTVCVAGIGSRLPDAAGRASSTNPTTPQRPDSPRAGALVVPRQIGSGRARTAAVCSASTVAT